MAININIVESVKQIIAGIPEYIEVTVDSPSTVFYTTDGTNPDSSGNSLTTLIMEHEPGNALQGIIFLPTNANILDLNIFAVGIPNTNVGVFYRRYGLEPRKIGIGRPGIKKPVSGGTAYTNTASPNTDPITGLIIAPDGYTEGYGVAHSFSQDGYDGYADNYNVAFSGTQTTIPQVEYDHISGFTNSNDGFTDGYATTLLTREQEQYLLKLSDSGPIFIDNGQGPVQQPTNFTENDPRSSTIVDSDGDQIEVVPVEDDDGYRFTTAGMFDPHAAYIEIDGRIDGYINGKPIRPGDVTIINKPYGELRYSSRREDLGDAIRTTSGYISGGLVCPIYDYNKGQAAFYYWDNHDYRWVVSLQKITPPDYKIFAKRNGVVVGQVFKWITGKGQILPG